ncbi:MAG: PAS domain S-box protein, partial [Planctomycetota bacterium]
MKSPTSFHLDETRPLLELFETLTESSPDGILVKDTRGRVLLINPAGARILGKRIEEIVGRENPDLFPPDVAARMTECDRRVLEKGLPDTDTFALSTSDIPRVYQSSSSPYRSHTGKILGVVSIIRDITDRERAAENRRVDADRIIRFQSALLDLEQSREDSIESMLKLILKTDAVILGVERVSFWIFAPNRSFIQCRLLYRRSEDGCERGMRLEAKDFPRYFEALEASRVVPADDARLDPR